MIPKQPAKATDAQKKRIKELAKQLNRNIEDFVCPLTKYRTSSIDQLYKTEASALISKLENIIANGN